MPRKPAEVVQAIKEKVAKTKAARPKPTPAEASTLSATPVPQPGTWSCTVCGNTATGAHCLVDGNQGKP